jgi:hypothetical protein
MKGSSLDYSLISTFKNGLEEGRILFETEIPDLSQAGDASPNSGGLAAFQLKGKRK